ncbi:MAG TPA: S8 family serine peptidase, partial [Chitinophagaceae bacterium]
SPPRELILPNDYYADAIPCGPDRQPLKHLELIGAPAAWEITTGSEMVKIAVSDNGFNKNHEDLLGKIDNPGTPTGFAAHGTMVAGLIAANTNNGIGHSAIGYNCQLLAYETGFRSFPYAILMGAKVINCSWYTGCVFNQNEQDVVNVAYDMGIVVVAAAGNGGTCGSPTSYVYPAAYDHVIAVTGVGHYFPQDQQDVCNGRINHQDVHVYRANSSAPYQTLQHNDRVDLSAPAYEVRGLSLSSYWNASGTSFASPIVAGVCGLLFSIFQYFTPTDIEDILKCTAFRLDNIPENIIYAGLLGAGRVDAYRAVLKAKTMLENRPADIEWYYYTRRGSRIVFDPASLYQHVSAGFIMGNTIFAKGISKIPGVNFDWEFLMGDYTIRKMGNPVSFDLTKECLSTANKLVVRVRNQVVNTCDPFASISHEETACLGENGNCWRGHKALIPDDINRQSQTKFTGNFPVPGVPLSPKPKQAVYVITPNVSSGRFTIRHYFAPVTLRNIQVFNTVGQLVWETKCSSGASMNIPIDLSRYRNGVYYVKLAYTDRTITERIVKRS